MRNNNTFGIKYPTGSIGRYRTEDINEMTNTPAEDMDDVHNTEGMRNKSENHKVKNTKISFSEINGEQK